MTAPPLVGASLSQRLMAQRESITAITLVICQSCWAVEGRISYFHASFIFTHRPSSSARLVSQWPVEGGDMSLLFPSPGLCGVPQGDGTHSRHSSEATVAPHHQKAQAPIREVEKDTLRLGNIVPLHCSVWQYFTTCDLAWKHCSPGSSGN